MGGEALAAALTAIMPGMRGPRTRARGEARERTGGGRGGGGRKTSARRTAHPSPREGCTLAA